MTTRKKETENWQEKVLELVFDNFPDGEYQDWGDWRKCELLAPHAERVLYHKANSSKISGSMVSSYRKRLFNEKSSILIDDKAGIRLSLNAAKRLSIRLRRTRVD